MANMQKLGSTYPVQVSKVLPCSLHSLLIKKTKPK